MAIDKEKRAIQAILEYFVKMIELAEISDKKTNAVKNQNYDLAGKLRMEERKLQVTVPKLKTLKKLLTSLNK